MWPGQQPPGGEQNPQDQNPYQQPGYQQPNPYQQPGYQQPGYQQPNPYQQPTAPQHAVPGQMPGAPQPPQDDKKKTTIIAIVAATAVVVAAGVTGFLVLNDDDDKGTSDKGSEASASKTPSSEASSETSENPAGSSEAPENPRGGAEAKPTIAGWKVVTNPKHGTRFDVPADWEVSGSGYSTGFEDEKKGDGSPAAIMGAPAHYKSKWCTFDSDKDGKLEEWGLASTGSKGASGAKDTAEAARATAWQWAWAAYAQTEPDDAVKVSQAKDFTSASGLKGSVATARTSGVKKENKCETDGKSIAFSFKNSKGDFKSWLLYANTGVKDEVDDATIQQILSTVRLVEPASS